MLSHLKIKNFKSIGEPGVELKLKPLTILVGPNGSGKTSILESLYFFLPSGPRSESGLRREELFYQKDVKRQLAIEVSFTDDTGFEISFGPHPDKTRVREGKSWFEGQTEYDSYLQRYREIENRLKERMFFISALRGNVPREVNPERSVMTWTGSKSENLIHVLVQLNVPENLDKRSKVEHWAGKFGIMDLWTGLRGDSIQLSYQDLGAHLPGISASYGARQILPIIANLFYCPSDSVFLIEEPEISLHPEGQVKLVEMFAEAIKEGKQVITTTHSSLLVLALNRPIKKGAIKRDDVAIYDVTKGPAGTEIVPLELTDEGYIKGWIPSFKKVEEDLMGEWVDSLPEA